MTDAKVCYNCAQPGHLSRDCSNPRAEGEAREKIHNERKSHRRCFNCGKQGHISADCDAPQNNKACYNCSKEGHISRDCPEPRK
mmetsp:Transcript_2593/g.3459  ORF Transcript_2593/g.3459 Transcript_2593/m.3459 type:complete len:84 (+) Transcript_2593:180-431(+)